MRSFLGYVLAGLALLATADGGDARAMPPGRYFGQVPPGLTPAVFAPGVISLSDRYECSLVFSPSLDECVFGVTNASWGAFNLWYTRMAPDSSWTDPVPAPFQGAGDGLLAAFSPGGGEVTFASSRPHYPPTRLWRSVRDGADWSAAVDLPAPIYSGANEWGSCYTDDGSFYFSSQRAGGAGGTDIYRAVRAPDGTVSVENLGAPLNSAHLDDTPFVAPDGSYIILESQRPGGFGNSDLYISFREGNGWGTPRNLGPAFNTNQIEACGFVSPDGKYFFFTRRRSFVTAEQTEIWWVDARAVLDPALSGADPAPPATGENRTLRVQPNPFGAGTEIRFRTAAPGEVTLDVYDVAGRRVACLLEGALAAGSHAVPFEPPAGERAAGGVYYCRLRSPDGPPVAMRLVAVR